MRPCEVLENMQNHRGDPHKMAEFKYISTKTLEPRPGTNFATTYYKQTDQEYQRLREFVTAINNQYEALARDDMDIRAWLNAPLRGYKKRTAGDCYTAWEIITDMMRQFEQKKDVPSGMLGRWQKLFAGTDFDIKFSHAKTAKSNTYGKLFEHDPN